MADVQPDGAVDEALTRVLGRSWRTSITGALFTVCGSIVSLSVVVPDSIPALLVAVCAVLTPVFGGAGLAMAKDRSVSGAPR